MSLRCLRYTERNVCGELYQAEQYLRGCCGGRGSVGVLVSVGALGTTWFSHHLDMPLDVLPEELSQGELRLEETTESPVMRVTVR